MCAGSELKDTQGETLNVEGADISDLKRMNDNHGKGFFNSLGIVTETKKIFKAEDCESDRHRYYWEKIKAPYIYAAGYLHNDEDHPNARAAAAILKNIHRDDIPLKIKASVEGGVISRGIKDPTRLACTKIHSIALTFTPANNATLVEPLGLTKSSTDWKSDKQLIKSVTHLAETNVPSFRHIERHASANTIYENINKIQQLAKSVGIEIMIKDIDPRVIMERAVLNKIGTNVTKINHLVKAIREAKPVGGSQVRAAADDVRTGRSTGVDRFQQNIGKLKNDPATPAKPKPTPQGPKDVMRVQGADKTKRVNTLKGHASRAMKNPEHLKTVHSSLVDRGVDPAKAKNIISRIRSHMSEDVKKSNDEIEKGDVKRAAKNLLIAGTMAAGANAMYGGDKDAPKPVKPKQAVERSVASKPKKMGYDKDPSKKEMSEVSDKAASTRKKAKEAMKWLRENRKSKLKKALMAGYGGAGAPTDLTGGGVFQAEKIKDDGKKAKKNDSDEFEYISCDDCGHEQVYMKHQVKCRKCGSSFNFDKLKSFI